MRKPCGTSGNGTSTFVVIAFGFVVSVFEPALTLDVFFVGSHSSGGTWKFWSIMPRKRIESVVAYCMTNPSLLVRHAMKMNSLQKKQEPELQSNRTTVLGNVQVMFLVSKAMQERPIRGYQPLLGRTPSQGHVEETWP